MTLPNDATGSQTVHDRLATLQETFFNTPGGKRFYCPARIHWGHGAFDLALPALTGCRATVFFDSALQHSRFVGQLRERLDARSRFIEVCAPPSPEGIADLCSRMDALPDAIVAIGGGSTIDTAKCVAGRHLYADIDGIGIGPRRGELPVNDSRPLLVAFPSTAGTGAETSRYYVSYRNSGSAKVYGKSWSLVCDWVFLDPEIGVTAPMRVKVESALDAFVHLTESFLCQEEESWPNSALCLAALKQLRSGLDLLQSNQTQHTGMLKLMSASSFAGIAVSNVRAGHIHEMAGAFLEVTGLTHPQTLAIFLADGLAEVHQSEAGRTKLEQIAAEFGCDTWPDVMHWWHELLARHGIFPVICTRIAAMDDAAIAAARHAVVSHTARDRVWNRKECPSIITDEIIGRIFDRAIDKQRTRT